MWSSLLKTWTPTPHKHSYLWSDHCAKGVWWWLRILICLPIVWTINYDKVYLLLLWFYFNFGQDNIVIFWWVLIIIIISLFLKRWEIWIINLKLIKFSCILGKYNTLQHRLEWYDSMQELSEYNQIMDGNRSTWSWCWGQPLGQGD